MGVLIGLWALGVGGRRLKGTSIAGLVMEGAGAIILPYNKVLTGNPMTPPLVSHYENLSPPERIPTALDPDAALVGLSTRIRGTPRSKQ